MDKHASHKSGCGPDCYAAFLRGILEDINKGMMLATLLLDDREQAKQLAGIIKHAAMQIDAMERNLQETSDALPPRSA